MFQDPSYKFSIFFKVNGDEFHYLYLSNQINNNVYNAYNLRAKRVY